MKFIINRTKQMITNHKIQGHVELAISKPKGAGCETPTSEPGYSITDQVKMINDHFNSDDDDDVNSKDDDDLTPPVNLVTV